MIDDNVWVVRVGKVRGEGEYITPKAAVFLTRPAELHESARQRDARRFTLLPIARRYALAFGGRVVRLRKKGGGR